MTDLVPNIRLLVTLWKHLPLGGLGTKEFPVCVNQVSFDSPVLRYQLQILFQRFPQVCNFENKFAALQTVSFLCHFISVVHDPAGT